LTERRHDVNGREPFPHLVVRPIEAGDEERLRRVFHRLSRESIHRRFFTLFPEPPTALLHQLTAVDHDQREALVVLDGDELVATASWDRPAGTAGEAEIAVLVEDSWQHRGLGRALVRMLGREAVQHGITVFTATTLSDNRAAIRLGLAAGRPSRVDFDGPETHMTFPLAG